ncbi:MAG: GHKL domain-containing protein [Planctomycetes bacterium]|nr:GHKL domain-containing protein [Planctomycetota bacterium]
MAEFLVASSILIQMIAAVVSLRLAWASRRGAWLALSLAILLMAARRSYSLYRAVALEQPIDPGAESIALGISILMAIGVLGLYRTLRAAQRGAGPDDTETSSPFPAAQYHARTAILLGVVAALGICVVGYFAHQQSSREILSVQFEHNQQLAKLMAGYIESTRPTPADADALESLRKFWQRTEKQIPGSYLCVIDAGGRLALHTARPNMAGVDVGDNPLSDVGTGDGPKNIRELADRRIDWTGWYTTQGGQRQLVSFTYLPARNALLAVHLPAVDVAARTTATAVPWIGGLALIGVVFIPVSLGLLHWGYSSALAGRRQAEAAREALIKELEDKNAELERFTYTVSHDLKSPLITIKGFLGALEQDIAGQRTEQVKADVATIAGAADHMNRLLDELLRLSRIGRVVTPPTDIPLGELVDETVRLLAGRIAQREASVEFDDDLPVVRGDRNRLREVLQNLIENALKFTSQSQSPHIQVGARRDADQTVIYVKDNGIGISPEYHQRVFDLFEQLDHGAEGTGVGLAIVKRVIEVHGGRIWVESAGADRGTTFCFTLNESAS